MNGISIYVASSWRNAYHPGVVLALQQEEFDVYDFRNPAPGKNGFAWSDIDPDWQNWTTRQFADALQHPVAVEGFGYDMAALDRCDAVVLVLPAGRSASLEAGYAVGAGKWVFVLQPEPCEPELMLSMCHGIFADIEELVSAMRTALEPDRDSALEACL